MKQSGVHLRVKAVSEFRMGEPGQNDQGEAATGSKQQICDRSGRGGQQHTHGHADAGAEADGIDRYGLGPTKGYSQQRQEQGADRVDMVDRVQRYTSQQLGGVISQPPRGPRVRPLMDGQ